jgi:hypothetical protein
MPNPRLPPRTRRLAGVVGLSLAALIASAAWLTPEARGWGTHEQLGWKPCWFRQTTGRPCPVCGMTTAWAYAVRGNAQAAVAANVGGALLAAMTVLGAAWLLGSAAFGKWIGGRPSARAVVTLGTAWLVVTLLDWARRLTVG